MASDPAEGPQSFYALLQAQDSILLTIPAEVRNHIYDVILANPTTVTICHRSKRRIKPIEHPLARTCMQIREEFLQVWMTRAVNCATTIVCAIRNFDIGDTGRVREMLAALSPLSDGSRRTFIMSFHIENHFEKSVRQNHRKQHQTSEKATQVRFSTNVAFIYESLDISHIERIMRTMLVPSNVLEAFLETKRRHKAQRAEQRRARLQAGLEGFEIEAAE